MRSIRTLHAIHIGKVEKFLASPQRRLLHKSIDIAHSGHGIRRYAHARTLWCMLQHVSFYLRTVLVSTNIAGTLPKHEGVWRTWISLHTWSNLALWDRGPTKRKTPAACFTMYTPLLSSIWWATWPGGLEAQLHGPSASDRVWQLWADVGLTHYFCEFCNFLWKVKYAETPPVLHGAPFCVAPKFNILF